MGRCAVKCGQKENKKEVIHARYTFFFALAPAGWILYLYILVTGVSTLSLFLSYKPPPHLSLLWSYRRSFEKPWPPLSLRLQLARLNVRHRVAPTLSFFRIYFTRDVFVRTVALALCSPSTDSCQTRASRISNGRRTIFAQRKKRQRLSPSHLPPPILRRAKVLSAKTSRSCAVRAIQKLNVLPVLAYIFSLHRPACRAT